MPNIINKIAIPDKYDPTATFSNQMIFLVGVSVALVILALIITTHFKRKNQKGSWFAFMVGISVYLLFYNIYFLPNIILSLLCMIKPVNNLLDDSDFANCLITAVILGALAYFGRAFASCVLRKRFTKSGDNFSIGLAISFMIGFFTIVSLLYVFFTCIAINQMGLQELADSFDNVDDLESMFDGIFDMMDIGVTDYFFRTISTISFMVAQILLTVPVISYVKKKMPGLKFSSFSLLVILMMFFQNLGGSEIIPAFVEAICVIGITVAIFLLVKKDYEENCKDEDEYESTSGFSLGNFKKTEQPETKSMPKFDNLSKL